MDSTDRSSWRGGLARRLERLAGRIADETATGEQAPGAPDRAATAAVAGAVEAAPGETEDAFAARRLRSVIEELYPTVAARVLALAEQGPALDVDEWVAVARLLYDAHMHRVGGPSIEAQQRALVATLGQALEAQTRSSARLAGFNDDELDQPSTTDGDPPGTLVWEHYLCRQARLARSVLHGEAVGDWLGALGDLWSATDALHDALEARVAKSDDDAEDDETNELLQRAKVALVRVEELSLW
jgi:hypothetical protein